MSVANYKPSFTRELISEESTLEWEQWVVSHLDNGEVLDIGCGIGLIDIHLAKNGFQVTGIDHNFDLISNAKRNLASEPQSLQEKVTFLNEDFSEYDFNGHQYASIMLHTDENLAMFSHDIFEKLCSLLIDQGKVIIVLPIGVKNFYLGNTVYSLAEICKILSEFIHIDAVKFWSDKLSIAGSKQAQVPPQDFSILQAVEDTFQTQLRDLNEQVRKSSLLIKNNNPLAIDEERAKNEAERETLTRTIDFLTLDVLRLRSEIAVLNRLLAVRPAPISSQAAPVGSSKVQKLVVLSKKVPGYYKEHGFRATVGKVFSKVFTKLRNIIGL